MQFFDFKKSLEGGAKAIYYLFGDDDYFLRRPGEILKEKYISFEEFNYTYFDFEKPPADYLPQLVQTLNSPPFMSEKRLVIADNFSVLAKEFDTYLKPYFENPNNSTIFVIISKKDRIDLKSKANVTAVNCNRLGSDALTSYVGREFSKAGASITSKAAALLVDYASQDFYKVMLETKKLTDLALGLNKEIETDDIKNFVAPCENYKLWEFADSGAKGDFEKAYKILVELLKQGINPSVLLFRLHALYSNLFEIAVSPIGDAEVAKKLGIKEYAAKMQRKIASRYTKKQLRRIVEYLSQTDADIKSGEVMAETALTISLAKAVYAI